LRVLRRGCVTHEHTQSPEKQTAKRKIVGKGRERAKSCPLQLPVFLAK